MDEPEALLGLKNAPWLGDGVGAVAVCPSRHGLRLRVDLSLFLKSSKESQELCHVIEESIYE